MFFLKWVIYLGLFVFHPLGDFYCNSYEVWLERTVRLANKCSSLPIVRTWVHLYFNLSATVSASGLVEEKHVLLRPRFLYCHIACFMCLFLRTCVMSEGKCLTAKQSDQTKSRLACRVIFVKLRHGSILPQTNTFGPRVADGERREGIGKLV